MSAPIETFRGAVHAWEADHMAHMNVRFYVAKFDDATWQLLHHVGITAQFLRSTDRGMAAVQQNFTYLHELVPGDLVCIESTVLDATERKLRMLHRMINCDTGEEVARAEMVGVHLDLVARRACAFPPEVFEKARALVAGEGT